MELFGRLAKAIKKNPFATAGGIVGAIVGLPLGPGAIGTAAGGMAIGSKLDDAAEEDHARDK